MEAWIKRLDEAVEPESMTLRDVFDSLVISGAGVRFSGRIFRTLCGPAVYMFLLARQALYVGVSEHGISRPAGTHDQAEVARLEADEVLIWPCGSEEKAYALETLLISRLQPKYNSRKAALYVESRIADILGVTNDALRVAISNRRIVRYEEPKRSSATAKPIRWHDVYAAR